MDSTIRNKAIRVMKANDRGGFTVPTANLYPYQWNWDSAFAAFGFATFDRDRAWRELEVLFEGQWANGMLPSIIFRQNDPDYFPGPTVWQTGTEPPTTGHSQPPVAASVAWRLVETGGEADLARAQSLFSGLYAYHRWFHDVRDPDGTGLAAITHPWESGRDNCPDWDGGLNGVRVPDDLEPYERRDLTHVDSSQRPTKAQYDRYLSIVKFGRDCGWNHEVIYHDGPFLVGDPGVQFILIRASKDLRALANRLGRATEENALSAWIERAEDGSQYLWNESVGGFCARDLRTGHFSDAVTSASMLAFYADVGTSAQFDRLVANGKRILDRVEFGFPSWDPDHDRFEPQRYWRGPVWSVMNYMIAEGLAEQGETEMAARLRSDTQRLTDETGFFEYFNPLTGEGYGGGTFTWTAAIRLLLSTDVSTSRAA